MIEPTYKKDFGQLKFIIYPLPDNLFITILPTQSILYEKK